MERASVKNGHIVFPDGMSYRLLVLPQWDTMTPALLRKISALVKAGATVVGNPPRKSPSLTNYPASDAEVRALSTALWGAVPSATPRQVGRGRVIAAAVASSVPKAADSPLKDAQWIWFAEGNPAKSAPAGTRYFRTNLEIAPNRAIEAAVVSVTADNSYERQ